MQFLKDIGWHHDNGIPEDTFDSGGKCVASVWQVCAKYVCQLTYPTDIMLAIALQGIADAEREDWATVGVQVECPSNSPSSFSDGDSLG